MHILKQMLTWLCRNAGAAAVEQFPVGCALLDKVHEAVGGEVSGASAAEVLAKTGALDYWHLQGLWDLPSVPCKGPAGTGVSVATWSFVAMQQSGQCLACSTVPCAAATTAQFDSVLR